MKPRRTLTSCRRQSDGTTQITPLHLNMITCAIANKGVLMKPYMVECVKNNEGNIIKQFESDTYEEIDVGGGSGGAERLNAGSYKERYKERSFPAYPIRPPERPDLRNITASRQILMLGLRGLHLLRIQKSA